jgi:CTP:molybdopterin cytidylyltransferase MocA
MIAAVVLAAGASTRMGRPKLILPLGSGTVLSAAVAPLLEAGLERVVVVLGDRAVEVERGAGLPEDPRLRVVVNASWPEGMASSLRRGLDECKDAEAVLVALGDQPGVPAVRLRRMLDAWSPGTPLVVPVHDGRAGHPVLFARELFGELRALAGDVGARDVVRRHWARAALVAAEPTRDIDTEEDYRALLEGGPGRPGEGLPVPERGRR